MLSVIVVRLSLNTTLSLSVVASLQRHGCHTADAQTRHEQRMTTDGATGLGVVATSDGRSVCFGRRQSRGEAWPFRDR